MRKKIFLMVLFLVTIESFVFLNCFEIYYGYINTKGDYIVLPKYDIAYDFNEGRAVVGIKNKKIIINKKGQKVLNNYPNIAGNYVKDGMVIIKNKKNFYGFYNIDNKRYIKPKYLGVRDYSSGLAYVFFKEKDKYVGGYINKDGILVIKLSNKMRSGKDFKNGKAIIIQDSDWFYSRVLIKKHGLGRNVLVEIIKYGMINIKGELIIKPIFSNLKNFSEGLALAEIGKIKYMPLENAMEEETKGRIGYIDNNGEFVITPKYSRGLSFSEGLAGIKREKGKWGFIDKKSKMVIPPVYDEVMCFSEGFAGVRKKDKWGFINKKGKLVIKIVYGKVKRFKYGLAPVKIKNKWGYINKKGRFVIKPKFEMANEFKEGLALIGVKN